MKKVLLKVASDFAAVAVVEAKAPFGGDHWKFLLARNEIGKYVNLNNPG